MGSETPAIPPAGATPPTLPPEEPLPVDLAATIVDPQHVDTMPDPTSDAPDPGDKGDHFDPSITLTEIRVPYRVHSHFLRFGQAQAIARLLEANPGDEDYDKLFYGAVAFLGPGAITAACVWLHRRGFPESTIHLLGLAREDSPSAKELMTVGTNWPSFFSRDIVVNQPGANNLIVLTDEAEKLHAAANSHLIFMNLKFSALKEVLTPEWIAGLHPGLPYALPNFIKSFEEEAGRIAAEEIYMRLAASGREDLMDSVAVIAGYTSAPYIYEGIKVPHIEIVVASQKAGERILRFFMPADVKPTVHPRFEDFSDAPKNFYDAPHLVVTLTIGSRDDVIAAGLGGALKNPLVIQTGVDVFNHFMQLPDTVSTSSLDLAHEWADRRHNEDIDVHLKNFLEWEGITAAPSIAVREDILWCSKVDYNAILILTREVKILVAGKKLRELKQLIAACQADKGSKYGSRNMQVGLYIAIAGYAVEQKLVDFPEEVFDSVEPNGWKVQEGVPGIKNLWRRRVTVAASAERVLPYGVRADSPRARGQPLPEHFQATKDLVYSEYSLPTRALQRLHDNQFLDFVQTSIAELEKINPTTQESYETSISSFGKAARLLIDGFRIIIPELRVDARFKDYVFHLVEHTESTSLALADKKFDERSFWEAHQHFKTAITLFAKATNLDTHVPNLQSDLAKTKNLVRLADRKLRNGEELRIEALVTQLAPLRPYNAPNAEGLKTKWSVRGEFIPDGYDALDDSQKLQRPWGLPRPWLAQLGKLVIEIADQVEHARNNVTTPKQVLIKRNLGYLAKVLATLKPTRGSDPNISGLLVAVGAKIQQLFNFLANARDVDEATLSQIVEQFGKSLEPFRSLFKTMLEEDTAEKILVNLALAFRNLREVEQILLANVTTEQMRPRITDGGPSTVNPGPVGAGLGVRPIFSSSPPVGEGQGEGERPNGGGAGDAEASTVVRIESRASLIHGGTALVGKGDTFGNMEHLMVGGAALAIQEEPLVIEEPVAKPARHLHLVEDDEGDQVQDTSDEPFNATVGDFNPIMGDVVARTIVNRPALRLVRH